MRPILIRMLDGRVGSTLVMQVLGTNPNVVFDRIYPFENSYLTYLSRLTGNIALPSQGADEMTRLLYGGDNLVGPLPFPSEGLDMEMVARESLRGVWEVFSSAVSIAKGEARSFYAEKYWGDVTPVIAAGLNPIVIDLVRDPRDVMASIRAFNAKTGRESFGRSAATSDREHLRHVVAGMLLRLREFEEPLSVVHLTVRYEDLVSQPLVQVARMEDKIGLRFDLDMVTAAAPSMAHHMTSSSSDSSVGRWRLDLAAAEVQLIERRLGAQMRGLGYSLSTESETSTA